MEVLDSNVKALVSECTKLHTELRGIELRICDPAAILNFAFSSPAASAEMTEQTVSAMTSIIRVKACMRSSVTVGRVLRSGFMSRRGPSNQELLFRALDDSVEENNRGGENDDSSKYPVRIEDALGLRDQVPQS